MKIVFLVIAFFVSVLINSYFSTTIAPTKINGISYVAPSQKPQTNDFQSLKTSGVNYTAITPYAFYDPKGNVFDFNSSRQWWGETTPGCLKTITQAKKNNIKIMLKPHLWVKNQGWNGDLNLTSKEKTFFLTEYTKYILHYAKIAEDNDVEIFCLGVEFRAFAVENKTYFNSLIASVRYLYKGKIVYAANWDYYDKIPFWDKLDYISIDAYFPLLNEATPNIAQLEKKWIPIAQKIKRLSEKHQKQIIFTEFGYRSADKCAWKQWEIEDDREKYNNGIVNLEAQANAYDAIFKVFWNKEWFAGGFVWKWYSNNKQAGGKKNNDFTPQNKPALDVMKKHYIKYN